MAPDLVLVGTYYDWDIEALEREFTLHILDASDAPDTLNEAVREKVRFLSLKGHAPLGGDYMDAFPNLEVIANFGVGYDAIDVAAATARNIRVTNTQDVLDDDVADTAVLLLLSQLKGAFGAERWVRDGFWPDGDYPLQRKMTGGHVGILGLGRIGRAIADRLAAFDMQISYFSRGPKDVPDGWSFFSTPEALAEAVDFMVVITVGGPETEGLVSREVMKALGPRGVLVNISRGSVVDETALLDLLETGELGGAALDVFWGEPNVNSRFMALDNVVLYPHIGSATEETRREMGRVVRENLTAARTGAPLLTQVN